MDLPPGYSFGRRTPYHRALLDGNGQRMYDEMLSAMKRGETSFQSDSDLRIVDIKVLKTILRGVLNDSPLLFWADGSIGTETTGSSVSVSIGINSLYDDREAYLKELERRCSDIYRTVSGSCSSQYDISSALHDHLADTVEYADTGDRGHCAIGPITDGKGVCDGIADAYSLLMNSSGVRCTKVDGHAADDDTGHSWNISVIDGHAYHTDATFDLGGWHRFLNLDDGLMTMTHRFNRFVQCDSLDANCHRRNGTLFDTVAEADRFIMRNLGKGRSELEFMVREGSTADHFIGTARRMLPSRAVSVRMTGDGRGFQLSVGAAGSGQVVGRSRMALRRRG